MSEETGTTSNSDAEKPAAAPKKAAARKPAAKKAAPKKTGASSSKKPVRTTTPTKAAAGGTSARKKTHAKAAGAKASSAKKASVTPKTAAETTASTAAATASAPQHGDVFEETAGSDTIRASAQRDSGANQSFTGGTREGSTATDDPYSADRIASELRNKDWRHVFARAAFTLFYMFASWIAIVLGVGLTIVQFLIYLVSGTGNDVIRRAILCIGHYIGDVAIYVSFASDDRPFPFGKDLPEGE
ncbi:DUF4389 domain-containing protein [Kordiimonas aestuarii]|uniref:DUF4389 domain-containing protein n=1 Tax=Kordiimonas aestuarii TaxID=1005925 RepID=UPI0021D01777|nr:DUF4389 domain-containing protein [Kordiimonas aestuarii]